MYPTVVCSFIKIAIFKIYINRVPVNILVVRRRLFKMKAKLLQLSLALLHYYSFMTIFRLTFAEVIFSDSPSSASKKVGEDRTFSCTVSGLKNSEYLTWLKDDIDVKSLDNNTLIIGDKETAFGNQTTLGIKNIVRNDAGIYQCAVISKQTEGIKGRSTKATLTVLSQPSQIYPICSKHEGGIILGSVITISCITERVQPRVNITITRNSNKVINGSFVENKTERTLKIEFKTTENDNGAMFKCHQVSPLEIQSESTCSIGPLNVQFKPEIHLQYTNPMLIGRETILFCLTTSNPPVTEYRWKLKPEFQETDYKTDNTGQILTLFGPSIEQNGTDVTCIATNDIGQSSSTITLYFPNQLILHSKDNNILQDQSSEKFESDINLSLDVIIIIAAGVVIIIVLIVLVPVYHYCLCRNDNSLIVDSLGKEITLPEVYYETREGVILRHTLQGRSLPRVPTTEVHGQWRHSTASQVPNDLESHSYTYIDTGND